ncbi:MAG: putative ABC exporter domain-containing protein [Fimbriimonadaceae bacterium]
MNALLFLTTRSLKNGLKRALTTPRRLISIVLFCAYYYWLFIRPSSASRRLFGSGVGELPAPAIEVLQALAFGLFVAMTIMLMVGMFTPLAGFRPADVDMLFPTPISPRIVLVFRILRDYLATLFLPLLIVILAFRPASMGWEAIFRKMPHPEYSALAMRAILVAWLLMALVWVSIAYAVTLYINRSDLQSDKNRRIVVWGLGSLIVVMMAYLGYSFSNLQSARELVGLAESPILRGFFFTATFATQMTMAPLTGDWLMGATGVFGLLGLTTVAMYFALRQSSWMYDQAAVKGFGSRDRQQMQQKGDMYGVVAALAREGKVKAGRRSWVHKLKLPGPRALLWKDYFLQTRGMKYMVILLFGIAMIMNLLPVLVGSSGRRGFGDSPGIIFITMQVVTNFMVTISFASMGFLELLRRVDLQKPLPFSPGTTVFMEVLSKSMLGIFASWLSAAVVAILRPEIWQYALAAIVAAPTLSVIISAATFLLTLMFPDIDDPSQRGLRGLLQMIAIIVLMVPGFALAAGGVALGLPPLVIAIPVAAINVAIAFVVSAFAGNFYASYNPSD